MSDTGQPEERHPSPRDSVEGREGEEPAPVQATPPGGSDGVEANLEEPDRQPASGRAGQRERVAGTRPDTPLPVGGPSDFLSARTAGQPPRPAALPVEEREYHHFLRTPRARWWRGALAIVCLILADLLATLLLLVLANVIDPESGLSSVVRPENGGLTVTPILFLANNLALAALTPIAMLLQWGIFGQRPRWLSSVQGVFRWSWFGKAALLVVPVWLVYIPLFYLLTGQPTSTELKGDTALLLVIVLVTTPLQATGE